MTDTEIWVHLGDSISSIPYQVAERGYENFVALPRKAVVPVVCKFYASAPKCTDYQDMLSTL